MNLVDCVVTHVLSEPLYRAVENCEWWQVEVEYVSWGTTSRAWLPFSALNAAKEVKEGYRFLA